MKTILIGGAMDIEITYFISQLKNCQHETINSFEFSIGEYCGKRLVVCKTEMGMVSAAIATAVGICAYSPDCAINQGTAGAHTESLHLNDIIIGKHCININALEMPPRSRGEGICPTEWQSLSRAKPIAGDEKLVEMFENQPWQACQKISGTIGSGDIFSKEYDRIIWLHEKFGELCEDMESASVYETCKAMQVPCVAIRVVSNNELTAEPFDENTAVDLQKFILQTLENN